MKQLDLWITGAVFLLAGSLALMGAASWLVDLGWSEANARRRLPAAPLEGRNEAVQGYWVRFLKDEETGICPVILKDGRLDPAYRYGPRAQRLVADFLFSRDAKPRISAPSSRFDYRDRRSSTMPESFGEDWIYTREGEFFRINGRHQIEEWLTESGGSRERRVCESLREAILPPLDLNYNGYQEQHRYERVQSLAMVYRGPDAIYRADLRARKVQRVAGYSHPIAFYVGWAEGPAAPRSYLLTRAKVHWVEAVPSGSVGEFDLPDWVRPDEDVHLASGSDGRTVLRQRTSGEDGGSPLRFRVAVFDTGGKKVLDYPYEFPGARIWPVPILPQPAMATWEEVLGGTLGGRLSGLLVPLAWRPASSIPASGLDLGQEILEGPFWIGLPIPAVLAVFVGRSARRRSKGWRTPFFWILFMLLFGLPALLVYRLLGRGARPVDEKPKMLGIEILSPALGRQP